MNSTSSIIHPIILVSLLALFSGCGGNSVEDKMYGAWEVSAFFTNEDFRQFSEEPIPDDVEIEMTVRGTHRFHKGGKYSAEFEFTIRFNTSGGEIPLRFHIKDAGEWSLHSDGKELVETTTDATITPLDDLTETFLKESPEMAATFKPVRGETTTSHILSISDTVMELQEDESKITLTLTKKR